MSLPPLILASQSKARQNLLHNAGLSFEIIPADFDEDRIKAKQNTPEKTATMLCEEKARIVSCNHPDALIIGGDQVLSFEGHLFSKARTKEKAKENLKILRGKTHELISAICVVQNKQTLWSHHDRVSLTMYDFDDDFLDHYLNINDNIEGGVLTSCVGGYALEKTGSWLFKKIEGDYFTVLGLPLLPLLGFLKEQGFKP